MTQKELEIVAEIRKDLKRRKLREWVKSTFDLTTYKARTLIEWAKALDDSAPSLPVLSPDDPLLRSAVVRELKKLTSVETIAKNLHTTAEVITGIVADLEVHGYIIRRTGKRIQSSGVVQEGSTRIVRMNHYVGKMTSFGVVADMHMCSNYERLDVLNEAYDTFAERGITAVLCPGNYVDGECRFNAHELKVRGIADQCHYAIGNWPTRKGITTYYVDGDDHEGWYQQREGIEFGRYLELEARASGRSDLVYMGYMEADIELKAPKGSAIIKVIHCGGGSTYATSYTMQKLAESFQGGEKPAVVIAGHYHKADYCFPRAVHCVQGGTCQDQTRFMRKKKLSAHLGFSVISLQQDMRGSVTRFAYEFYPFWDRGYYIKRDVQL